MNRLLSVFAVLQYVVNLKYRIYSHDCNELNLSYPMNVFKYESFERNILFFFGKVAIGRL